MTAISWDIAKKARIACVCNVGTSITDLRPKLIMTERSDTDHFNRFI